MRIRLLAGGAGCEHHWWSVVKSLLFRLGHPAQSGFVGVAR